MLTISLFISLLFVQDSAERLTPSTVKSIAVKAMQEEAAYIKGTPTYAISGKKLNVDFPSYSADHSNYKLSELFTSAVEIELFLKYPPPNGDSFCKYINDHYQEYMQNYLNFVYDDKLDTMEKWLAAPKPNTRLIASAFAAYAAENNLQYNPVMSKRVFGPELSTNPIGGSIFMISFFEAWEKEKKGILRTDAVLSRPITQKKPKLAGKYYYIIEITNRDNTVERGQIRELKIDSNEPRTLIK